MGQARLYFVNALHPRDGSLDISCFVIATDWRQALIHWSLWVEHEFLAGSRVELFGLTPHHNSFETDDVRVFLPPTTEGKSLGYLRWLDDVPVVGGAKFSLKETT